MKAPKFVVVLAMLVTSVGGCAIPPAVVDAGQPGGVVSSDRERVSAPDVPAADLLELAAGNSTFAFDLYEVLRQGDGNLFYSPYSISVAIAMTYAGARGATAEQIAETMHFALTQEELHAAFNALDLALAQRGEGVTGRDDKGFRLNIVNAIWGQSGYPFLDAFLDLLAENYGAGLRLLDFVKAPEQARQTINDWVSEQTEGRIEDLIPSGVIDSLTRLVLTNAIYFNAAWAYPFTPDLTEEDTFHLLDGGEESVPMMRQEESFSYVEGDGFQAVELPYDGMELSMVILLPDTGEFERFEGSLSASSVTEITQQLGRRKIVLRMPKFEFESSSMLASALASLGMSDAFSSAADFSGMTGNRDLFISDVVHKAFVSVDEAGTEAAAATAVVMKLTAEMPEEPLELTIDRPFVFFIRDLETGTILFVGRVMDPTS